MSVCPSSIETAIWASWHL